MDDGWRYWRPCDGEKERASGRFAPSVSVILNFLLPFSHIGLAADYYRGSIKVQQEVGYLPTESVLAFPPWVSGGDAPSALSSTTRPGSGASCAGNSRSPDSRCGTS